MPLIDDRGRVFGRLNVVDAAIVTLLVLMIPVAYGAYWLFRDPPALLTAVQPPVLTAGGNLQVQVVGRNFRPYMRVSFGPNQGAGFLFQSDTRAMVGVPNLPAGKYDVILYDYAQEVSRLKDALTINVQTFPVIPVALGGVFTSLSPDQASQLEKGHKLPETGQPVATIMEVEAPRPSVARIFAGDMVLPVAAPGLRDLPATISLSCSLQLDKDSRLRCFHGALALGPDVVIALNGLNTTLNFRIAEVHYSQNAREARVRARFPAPAGLRSEVKPGDRDIGAKAFPSGAMATIVSVMPESATDLTARITLQAEQTPVGWTYKGQPVKVGAHLIFETPRYRMEGVITDVELPDLKDQ